jgi:hypothetical protein
MEEGREGRMDGWMGRDEMGMGDGMGQERAAFCDTLGRQSHTLQQQTKCKSKARSAFSGQRDHANTLQSRRDAVKPPFNLRRPHCLSFALLLATALCSFPAWRSLIHGVRC